jgi:hypothetical protein
MRFFCDKENPSVPKDLGTNISQIEVLVYHKKSGNLFVNRNFIIEQDWIVGNVNDGWRIGKSETGYAPLDVGLRGICQNIEEIIKK